MEKSSLTLCLTPPKSYGVICVTERERERELEGERLLWCMQRECVNHQQLVTENAA